MSSVEQTNYPPRIESELGAGLAQGEMGESPLKVLWRYKFFVALLASCGLGYGYWRGQQKPTTYGAGTQLMIKSDRPLSLDSTTGTVIGGVPNSDILSALITSDPIIQVASVDPEMTSLASMQNRAPSAIGGVIRSGIRFSARTESRGSSDRMIAALSYDGTDPDICVAAVNSTMRAIQKYFDEERKSSATQLAELINEAEKKLLPQLTQLESQYQEFRGRTPLEWGADGKVINPHRERQASLQVQFLQAEQDLRRKNSNFRLIQTSWETNHDAVLVSYLISQVGSGNLPSLKAGESPASLPELGGGLDVALPELRDLELEQLTVEQSLVPLLVQQQQLVVELGPNHPAVRNIDSRVAATRKALNELTRKRQNRIEEIQRARKEELTSISEGSTISDAAREAAERYVNTYLAGLRG
ncbi:MAG TPA: hypothetical protein DDZ51_21125, partial [Planctomycetaceae bacterium]|nr:hypothetical protein [Planctomycetaceae bacterium]